MKDVKTEGVTKKPSSGNFKSKSILVNDDIFELFQPPKIASESDIKIFISFLRDSRDWYNFFANPRTYIVLT